MSCTTKGGGHEVFQVPRVQLRRKKKKEEAASRRIGLRCVTNAANPADPQKVAREHTNVSFSTLTDLRLSLS